MPYNWIRPQPGSERELHLWPHQSLPPQGYVRFLGATAALACVPLMAVLGSVVLWGLLPFVLLALFGMKFALDQSRRDRQILEVLTLSPREARLERSTARGTQNWQCNRYWATVELYRDNGPVPNYVTLKGCGREVEIGAFLCEEERLALYEDLKAAFAR
ncbi:DUF2244 domain-containing protein [Cribrihabitans neustonicus]|uniref:DUF2244 domain-containing protein n=1 Tax=Cribrihabitans neustonicus TaxID=1429085 RepID=UPI003B5B80C4